MYYLSRFVIKSDFNIFYQNYDRLNRKTDIRKIIRAIIFFNTKFYIYKSVFIIDPDDISVKEKKYIYLDFVSSIISLRVILHIVQNIELWK